MSCFVLTEFRPSRLNQPQSLQNHGLKRDVIFGRLLLFLPHGAQYSKTRSNIIVDICTEGSRRATVAVCAMKALGPIQEGFATFWGPFQVLENELYVTQYITFAEPKCPIHHKIMF